MEKGIIGKPKYKRKDVVQFVLEETVYQGTVDIVDAYGTFEQNEEPSYDILTPNFRNGETYLVKHIRESSVISTLKC